MTFLPICSDPRRLMCFPSSSLPFTFRLIKAAHIWRSNNCSSSPKWRFSCSDRAPLLRDPFFYSIDDDHHMMDNVEDLIGAGSNGDFRRDRLHDVNSSSAPAGSESGWLGRQKSIHQIMGGGKAADVILWKHQRISFGIMVVFTVGWLMVERSGLSFLTICSDVLLVLVVILFVRAKVAALLNKQLQPLPELVLSEEMVNNAAASFRVKINYMLLMAHDITVGKNFRLFFMVVIFLWILSVVGSICSFFTFVYICIIFSITIPALYSKYQEHVDRYAGLMHTKISKHYSVVDENVRKRIPKGFSRDKDN